MANVLNTCEDFAAFVRRDTRGKCVTVGTSVYFIVHIYVKIKYPAQMVWRMERGLLPVVFLIETDKFDERLFIHNSQP
jgi:hypothetical protein